MWLEARGWVEMECWGAHWSGGRTGVNGRGCSREAGGEWFIVNTCSGGEEGVGKGGWGVSADECVRRRAGDCLVRAGAWEVGGTGPFWVKQLRGVWASVDRGLRGRGMEGISQPRQHMVFGQQWGTRYVLAGRGVGVRRTGVSGERQVRGWGEGTWTGRCGCRSIVGHVEGTCTALGAGVVGVEGVRGW